MRPLNENSTRRRHACERRGSKRLLCSALVQVTWQAENGVSHSEVAILENLSLSGVGVFTGVPVPQGAEITLAGEQTLMTGTVKQCMFRENGYIVGIELNDDSKSAQQSGPAFVPEHLLDVSLLEFE